MGLDISEDLLKRHSSDVYGNGGDVTSDVDTWFRAQPQKQVKKRNGAPLLHNHHSIVFHNTMSLYDDTDCVPGRGRRFVLKNLAAEEWTLTIRRELATLDDLRLHIQRQLRVPMAMQRFAVRGRSYSDQTDGSLSLNRSGLTTAFLSLNPTRYCRDNR